MDRLLPVSFVICLFLVIGLSDAVNERLRIQKITEAVRPTIAPRPPLPHEPERCDSRILIGMPGASGPAGSQGMPGVQGPSGFPGASGNNGINGSPGPDGLRGPKGDAGAPGETGEQGLDGLQGFSGPAGERGVSGPIGNPGLTGPSGVNGPDGYKGDPGYPGESGIAGRPGRKGDSGLPGVNGECSCPIPYYDGPRGRRTPVRPVPVLPPSRGAKSAFSAARTTDLQATDGAVTVTYQKVFSNQGNHFNKDTGVFRCAIAGTYFFTMSIYKSSAEGFPLVQLLHNQRPVIAVVDHESADAADTATNSVVLDLAVGDEISLELKGGWELASNENRLTTFSGFLLFEA